MKEVDGRVDLRLGRKLVFIDFISAFTFILDCHVTNILMVVATAILVSSL